jgi:hypothetical protein
VLLFAVRPLLWSAGPSGFRRETDEAAVSRLFKHHFNLLSEYQYYEFQAIDRPLTDKEMGVLRACSTRARITPTSFVNDY